jgi:hypothetical protein
MFKERVSAAAIIVMASTAMAPAAIAACGAKKACNPCGAKKK